MISALEEFPRLLREMFLSPRAVDAIGPKRQQDEHGAGSETPAPPKKEFTPRDRADVAKAIFTFGILHCDEE
ncbi:MAG: hypothetical protein QOD12_1893 [Verrucomicrobiota bacterium]